MAVEQSTRQYCGTCVHVEFLGDWDRTPYCSRREESVRVFDAACDGYESRS